MNNSQKTQEDFEKDYKANLHAIKELLGKFKIPILLRQSKQHFLSSAAKWPGSNLATTQLHLETIARREGWILPSTEQQAQATPN